MLTVSQSCFPCLPLFALSERTKSQIKEIALKALKELVISCAYSLTVSYFVATGISVTPLFLSALAVTILNIFIRSVCTYVQSQREQQSGVIRFIENYAPPLIFSLHDFSTRGLLFHEAGHFFSVKILFDTRAKIVFHPFSQMVTKHSMKRLTGIGNYLGRKVSQAIVFGAGAGLSMIMSSCQLIAAHRFKQSHPELARYLKISAITNIFAHAAYALSACWSSLVKQPGHDFLLLQKVAGISPIVSLIAIVALPLIVQVALYS